MGLSLYTDETFMREALKEAGKAFEQDEVPVGAVVVCDNQIVARSHNATEQLTDSTAHAEMQALTAAMNYLRSKYLNECTLFVTLEPCAMCAGALYWSQIGKIVYAAADEKRGFRTVSDKILHPATALVAGPFEKESRTLLQTFFQKKRES
ncbi:MAG: nucleoside deaminase [Bacteroidales bacterium]|nr:nucleoside deaminase [Bacteroidales bacterium]